MEDKIKYKIVYKKTRRDIEELDKSLDEGTEEGKIKIIGERVKVSLEVLLEISCVIDLTEQENTEYEELDKKGRVSIGRVEQIEKEKKQKNLQKLISRAMRRLERVVCRAGDNLKVTKNKVMLNNLKVDKRDLLESMESLEKDMISLQEIDNRDQLNNDWETLKDKTELILDEIDYSLTVHFLDTINDTPASNMQSQMNASTHSVSSPLCYPPVYSSFQGPSGEHRATVEALPDYFPGNTGSPSTHLHPVSSHHVSLYHSLPHTHNDSSHISVSQSFPAQYVNPDHVSSPAHTVTSQHFIPPIFPTQHSNVSSHISIPQSFQAQHSMTNVIKPIQKDEATERHMNEAMSKVKEAQKLISAAADTKKASSKSPSRRRSRSRSRNRGKRSRSKSRRSRSRSRRKRRSSRSRSRKRSRSRRRSRSPRRRRSRSRGKPAPFASSSRHSRSRDRRRSRTRSPLVIRRRRSISKRDRKRSRSRDRKEKKKSSRDKDRDENGISEEKNITLNDQDETEVKTSTY